MKKHADAKVAIKCREARRRFPDLCKHTADASAADAVRLHLQSCEPCAREYRIFSLTRATLDLAAAPEPVRPEEDFFVALRARLARGPEAAPVLAAATSDSWAAAILLTARQMIPALALLLLLIIGATFIWDNASMNGNNVAVRPSERVLFNDVYDYPAPTRDDVLQTLVAVEERENGK
ncbi:MAG TPA: hypothetical protein VNO70_02540 [Blastocatellia bacterium]|nr:hypothetical protein [Blastocatellia bacterium]